MTWQRCQVLDCPIEEVADLLPDASAMTQKDFIEFTLKIGSNLPVPNGQQRQSRGVLGQEKQALVKMTDESLGVHRRSL